MGVSRFILHYTKDEVLLLHFLSWQTTGGCFVRLWLWHSLPWF